MSDDKTPEKEQVEEKETTGGEITRRQFLVGAGVGAVVGAAGVAGVTALTSGKSSTTTTTPQVPTGTTTTTNAPANGIVSSEKLVTLNVNGTDYSLAVKPSTTLFEVLKQTLGLTGVKLGCNGSMCSACTVLVDGVAQNSCSMLAIRESGKKITTIEGLAKDGKLHPVQVAFWENQGYQCGFCTSGQILGTVELLSKIKNPTEEQIRSHMSGHLCKCSAYPNIIKSVQAAAKAMA